MGRIVAIGGGEIGRPGYAVETNDIDIEIIRMTGIPSPNLLFIPTASSDSETYIDAVQNHFGLQLGCQVNNLLLHCNSYTKEELRKMIFSSDIIYVGGGNTKMMLSIWKKTGLDKILKQAFEETEIIFSGLSAGAICWFSFGSSDSEKFENPDAPLINLPCLGFIDLVVCPHFDVEKDRKPDFKKIMKQSQNIGIGLDNCCALKIEGNSYQIITSKKDAHAWSSKWENGTFHEIKLKNGAKGMLGELNPAPINVI